MNRTQPERFVCGTFRCKQRLSMQNRIFINIFTLIYVKIIFMRFSRWGAPKIAIFASNGKR